MSASTPPTHEPSEPAALVLAIEISNPSAAGEPNAAGGQDVAFARVARGTVEILASEPVAPATRHSDDLLPAIDRLATRLALDRRSICCVMISAGPGGFTAVRVACATAVMIAQANSAARGPHGGGAGCRCVGVPSAMVAAWNRFHDHPPETGPIAVALGSKGETAFITLFPPAWAGPQSARNTTEDAPQPALLEPMAGRVMSAGDFAQLEARPTVLLADRHLPAAIRQECARLAIPVAPPRFTASACAQVGARLPTIDAGELRPLYPREPEAVTLWRSKGRESKRP